MCTILCTGQKDEKLHKQTHKQKTHTYNPRKYWMLCSLCDDKRCMVVLMQQWNYFKFIREHCNTITTKVECKKCDWWTKCSVLYWAYCTDGTYQWGSALKWDWMVPLVLCMSFTSNNNHAKNAHKRYEIPPNHFTNDCNSLCIYNKYVHPFELLNISIFNVHIPFKSVALESPVKRFSL